MARAPQKRLEDWMRLILLNWVLISLAMFYSIIMGIAGGCLVILAGASVTGWAGLSTRFLRLYPSPAPTPILVIGGLIAALFIHLFKNLHYDCASGNYSLSVSKVASLGALAGIGAVGLILLGIGAVIAWLSPS